ncbi:MAG: hypothetical protein V2A34_08185 [Lentisphaerota bacterium]
MADQITKVPEGYAMVPLSAPQKDAPVKVAVLVRSKPEPSGGALVVLRRTMDAMVLLGGLTDRADRVHRWFEIWIQQTGAIYGSPLARRQALSNTILDARWSLQFQALENLESDLFIETGWETSHPLPLFIRTDSMTPLHPLHAESGNPWRLCENDAVLLAMDLPAYSSSLHRYWHVAELGDPSPFVPVTAEAPKNASCISMEQALGACAGAVAVNPEGGLMLIRDYSPLRMDDFIDVLGGRAWDGLKHGRSVLALTGTAEAFKDTAPEEKAVRRLFLSRHGTATCFLERYYLKLKLLADAVSAVSRYIELAQEPLLNLSVESFSLQLQDFSPALPLLWAARLRLADAGNVVSIPLSGTGRKHRIMLEGQGPSIFWAALLSRLSRGQGTVRIRKVQAEVRGQTLIEGTFETREAIEPGRNDLLWLRLPGATGCFDLYAQLEKASSLAAGEWRFRSSDQSWSKSQAEALKAMEGVVSKDVPFEVLPQLSSPCDLYAIGVLAVRILLQNKQVQLPVMLDHVLSLTRQVEASHDPNTSLSERLARILHDDPRWAEALGPHNLLYEPVSAAEGQAWMPEELWRDTLAMILQTFPGFGPDSRCKDFSDSPEGQLQRVFDRITQQLDALLLRTRSVLLGDAPCNHEIHEVIQRFKR